MSQPLENIMYVAHELGLYSFHPPILLDAHWDCQSGLWVFINHQLLSNFIANHRPNCDVEMLLLDICLHTLNSIAKLVNLSMP